MNVTVAQPGLLLDEWDIAVIQQAKGLKAEDDVEAVRAIWAQRCALDLGYVQNKDIVRHLFQLVEKLQLQPSMWNLIEEAHPENQWKYGKKDSSDYWRNWLHVLLSCLRLTEVSKLPGYQPGEPKQWRTNTAEKTLIRRIFMLTMTAQEKQLVAQLLEMAQNNNPAGSGTSHPCAVAATLLMKLFAVA